MILAMAAWFVLRHRALLLCVALCILLAAFCLQPGQYLRSLQRGVEQKFLPPPSELCLSHVQDLEWKVGKGEEENGEGMDADWSWIEEDVPEGCRYQKMRETEALELMKGKRVMVAGDSQARLFLLALMELLLPESESVAPELFKRHSNYRLVREEEAMVLDFVWAPYTRNITQVVLDLGEEESMPNLMVLGTGLWHMLHVTNATAYELDLRRLREAVISVLLRSNVPEADAPKIFWLNVPTLVSELLNTPEKRAKMTKQECLFYDQALARSKILHPHGPAVLLDMRRLTQGCGMDCTADGMHYRDSAYQAAVQISLNALRISSNQMFPM